MVGKRGLFVLVGIVLFLFISINIVSAVIVDRGSYWDKHEDVGNTNTLTIFNTVVNYHNGTEYVSSNIQIINSSFQDYEFEIINAPYKAYFQNNINSGKGIRFEKDGYFLTYDLAGGKMQWVVDNKSGIPNEGKTNAIGAISSSAINLSVNNKVIYSNAFLNTDIQYIFTKSNLKENFVLKSAPLGMADFLYLEYTGEIEHNNNLTIFANGKDQTGKNFNTTEAIEFRDLNNQTIFSLPKPVAIDANGSTTNMKYDVKIGGGKIQFHLRVPSTWIINAIFPVIIDPTLSLRGVGGADAYVKGDAANTNKGSDPDLFVKWGSPKRNSYIRFNISAIPDNQIIENATMCLYLFSDAGSDTLSVYHVYQSWNETDITWNNQPCGTSFDNDTYCNLTAESSLSNDGNQDNTWQCFDVTNMVTEEYSQANEVISSVLHTLDSSNADKFYSKEHIDSSLWPYLNVTYSSSDIVNPDITLTFPLNQSYTLNVSDLNYTVNDDTALQACWYSLDRGVINNTITCGNNITGLTSNEGSNTWTVYANDSVGNVNSSQITFVKDTINPLITLNDPSGFVNSNLIFFNYTPIDVNLASCELWGNFTGVFEKNQTDFSPVSGTVNQFNLTLSEEAYSFGVFCNDTLGNSYFAGNNSFTIDTTIPSLNLIAPEGSYSSQSNIPIEFSASDQNINSCKYNVFRGASPEIINTTIACNQSTSFDVSGDGSYILYFFVNDSAGNINSTNLSFTVITPTPPPTGGGGSGGGGGGGGGGASFAANLDMGTLSNIIANPGERKLIIWNAKNTGITFLNNCRVEGMGNNSEWITPSSTVQLGGGESKDFAFNLNIPDKINAGSYELLPILKCNEREKIGNFSVEIIEKQLNFKLIEALREENDQVKIVYSLEEISGIDQNVEVQFLIYDSNNEKISEVVDNLELLANSENSFEVLISVDPSLSGNFNLLINLNSETYSTFIQEGIVLAPAATGLAIFNDNLQGNKLVAYGFVLMFFIFAAFMVVRIVKLRNKSHRTKDYSKLKK